MAARRWISPILGLAIGAAFIYAIVAHVNLSELRTDLQSANPLWIALAVLCSLTGLTLRALRWWLLLRTATSHVRFTSGLRIFFGSFALNNVLPFRLGDVARTFGFTDILGCTGWTVLGTLVTERVLDILILLGIAGVVIGGTRLTLPPALTAAMQGMVAFAGALILCLFVLNAPLRAALSSRRITVLAERLKAVEYVRHRMLDVATAVARSSKLGQLPILLALSIAGWCVEGTVFILMQTAISHHTNTVASLLGFGWGTLATMLPGPPGNFGTFDFFAIRGLMVGGIPVAQATAIALLSHVIIWAPVTILGAAFLLRGSRSLARLTAASEASFT